MRRILIMHQTITNHDAIGNDIECMYTLLKERTICKCFAENKFNTTVDYAEKQEAMEIMNDSSNIVIYHHSVNWPLGEEMLNECKAMLIFRYHNITPPEFFEPYNQDYTFSCAEGRKMTERLIKNYPGAIWLSDSVYNASDLKNVPREKISICAPMHKIEEWTKTAPDENVLKNLMYNKKHNILFVGRVAPNKGHLFLLDILHAYCQNFGDDIKLHIIGKFDEGIATYNKLIHDKIKRYHLEDKVEFVGEINDATLMSYYLGSEVFLCASDHEGFCVPIIEAQRFLLPIIAKDSSAITETIGKNQIVLNKDPKEYAAAIKLIIDDKETRTFLRDNGEENYRKRFTLDEISAQFMRFMKDRGI